MIIRPALIRDLDRVVTLLEKCDMRLDDVSYEHWDGVVLVAERQNEVIGFIHMLPARPYSVITHIVVSPEERRGGLAAVKLIESAELILRHMNCGNWFTHIYEKEDRLRASVQHWGADESPCPGYLYKRIL